MSDLISFDNPVFSKFAFYSGIVLSKTMLMSGLIGHQRGKHKYPPPNPEDFKLLRIPVRDLNVTPNDTVERTRRCHRNDLENVIPFVLIGLLYVTTNPDPTTAAWHFRIFTGFRIFHTFAYLMVLPRPSRGIGFLGGFLATVSMAISVLKSTLY